MEKKQNKKHQWRDTRENKRWNCWMMYKFLKEKSWSKHNPEKTVANKLELCATLERKKESFLDRIIQWKAIISTKLFIILSIGDQINLYIKSVKIKNNY